MKVQLQAKLDIRGASVVHPDQPEYNSVEPFLLRTAPAEALILAGMWHQSADEAQQ